VKDYDYVINALDFFGGGRKRRQKLAQQKSLEFKAEILDKKEPYNKGDSIIFRSEYQNKKEEEYLAFFIIAEDHPYQVIHFEAGHLSEKEMLWKWVIPKEAPVGHYKACFVIRNFLDNPSLLREHYFTVVDMDEENYARLSQDKAIVGLSPYNWQ
jgi:hypothetical protein